MKSKAAILRGVGMDWEVREIELDEPRSGEVLVRMGAASLCHTDDHFATGDCIPSDEMAEMMRAAGLETPDMFPLLGGHEGAGIIEQVGPEVSRVRPGDRVGMSFIPACGTCRWCASGQSYICDNGAHLFSKGMVTDGTVRRHLDGEALMATTQLGTFSEYIVVSQDSLIRVDDTIPFHAVSLVSCGVTTGYGSATVSAGTQPGDTVVVVGLGGVGMGAVQGARIAGATQIIGIDPVEFKRESAPCFGATHTAKWAHEALELVRDVTAGIMADRVVLCAGVVHSDLIPVGMMLTRKGGTCVLTGMTPLREMSVPLLAVDMTNSVKQLKGTTYGEMNPRASMPRLLTMYRAGSLKLDEMVTRRYRLDEINDAIADMRAGRIIRGVIDFP